MAFRGLLGPQAPQDRRVALESQEQRGSEDPQEPRGRKEPKDLPGLLKYLTYWGTKESQASKGLQGSQVRKETEAFPGSRV